MYAKNTATYAFDITPGADIATDAGNTKGEKAVYVYTKTAGNVTVTTSEGVSITFTAVPAFAVIGGDLPLLCRAVTAATAACVALVVRATN